MKQPDNSPSRAEIATKAARTRWLRSTHRGKIRLLDEELACYVLDDQRRVLSGRGMLDTLHMSDGGHGTTDLGNNRLRRFVRGKILYRFIRPDTIDAIENPIRFRTPGDSGSEAFGFEAEVLIDLAIAVVKAADAGQTQPQQAKIVQRCRALVQAFAKTGLVALIDEATGFQHDRARDALAQILEAYVEKELQEWSKTFPDDFYSELCRLRGISLDEFSTKRPSVLGRLTNDIVYERLAPGLLDELRRVNPRTESGHRRAKHHQWLTRTVGHPRLAMHLGGVVMLMRMCSTWDEFQAQLDQRMQKFNKTIPMSFMGTVPRRPRPTAQTGAPTATAASSQSEMF